jgi:XTP/dITP diphosphohydrolase
VEEIRAILQKNDVTLLARPRDVPDVEENGDTLEANALLKARALVAATGEAAIADDTGLFVDVLGGDPGVHSARYAGEHATDQENIEKLLRALEGVPTTQRSAYFRTVAAVAYLDGRTLLIDGRLDGWIANQASGAGGFGYDPVFCVAELEGTTLAELSLEQKNDISHRARAFRSLAKALLSQ